MNFANNKLNAVLLIVVKTKIPLFFNNFDTSSKNKILLSRCSITSEAITRSNFFEELFFINDETSVLISKKDMKYAMFKNCISEKSL